MTNRSCAVGMHLSCRNITLGSFKFSAACFRPGLFHVKPFASTVPAPKGYEVCNYARHTTHLPVRTPIGCDVSIDNAKSAPCLGHA
jgi:hypothetical protein